MPRPNSQKIHSLKNIWRTLGSLRGLHLHNFKEKYTLLSHLMFLASGKEEEVLIMVQKTQRLLLGLLLTTRTTGLLKGLINKGVQLLRNMPRMFLPKTMDLGLFLYMVTPLEINGKKNLNNTMFTFIL